jgi:hypothetical protein
VALEVGFVVEADLQFRRERRTDGIVRCMVGYQSQVPDSPNNPKGTSERHYWIFINIQKAKAKPKKPPQ